jgi:Putative Flp pilus-assembly TadE/G-like
MRDLTRRLGRTLRRRPARGERGGIGVLVALLLSGGVLMGMGALAIDAGALYSERAQLQNGADAAALGVARSCAVGVCAPGAATHYADANAADGVSAVSLVCGSGTLGLCPASTGALTDCPPAPPGGSYVDVHTSTQTRNGSALLPPALGRLVVGPGYQGTTVLACAQAQWGPPASATTIALTVSACAWERATDDGTSYAPPPPYPPNLPPSAAFDQVLVLRGRAPAGAGCPAAPSAQARGTAGWTLDGTGMCTLPITGSTYLGSPAGVISPPCQAALRDAWSGRSVLAVPVFAAAAGGRAAPVYTLKGFAAFVVTGYSLPGFSAPDWLNPGDTCGARASCIDGYFTRSLIPSAGAIGGPDLGAAIVKLTG